MSYSATAKFYQTIMANNDDDDATVSDDDDQVVSDDDDVVVSDTDDDDASTKYQIGTIIYDDGSVNNDEYTEIEEVDDPTTAAPNTKDAVLETEADDETSDSDDFLPEANFDPDDPERYWEGA